MVPKPSIPAPARRRVLMIDDDRELAALIRDYLEPLGYELHVAFTGDAGLERALGEPWHAILLDVMLPGLDGFEVLRRIRADSEAPVLILSGRSDETDRVVGLELGADDYLPKTFSMRELLARLRAVTRRAVRPATGMQDTPEPELVIGPLRIHSEARRAVLDDRPLHLRPVEFDLLLALARARGRVRSRESLLEQVRDREYGIFDRSIDMHISALRRKLGDDPKSPRFIRTYRSAGYMLIDPAREFPPA